jgi:hypothetical protein
MIPLPDRAPAHGIIFIFLKVMQRLSGLWVEMVSLVGKA